MVQVFDEAVSRRRFTPEQSEFMRDAYARALSALELTTREQRLRLARIVFKLHRMERFPEPSQLTALAVDWYLSGQGLGDEKDHGLRVEP